MVPSPLCTAVPRSPCPPELGDSPMRKGSVVVLWVLVTLLYSLCTGFWKSPEWLPSCGKGPGTGRSVGRDGVRQRQGPRGTG